MNTQSFYGHGKLLLTGEYAVLDGAKALAIPTKFGQSLTVNSTPSSGSVELSWNSKDVEGETWLSLNYPGETRTKEEETLGSLLQLMQGMQANFLSSGKVEVISQLEFPREWGLGSSSTLIACLAQWANVDPYALLASSFGGSGYDIAAAMNDLPIVFSNADKKVQVQPRRLDFSFANNLYFVYLGKKKNSRDAIRHYRSSTSNDVFLHKVEELTEAFIWSRDLQEMQEIMVEHEAILSNRLKTEVVKKERFSDFKGAVKSLGGWGGDFVLMATSMNKIDIEKYIQSKGLKVVFSYEEMIFPS